MRAPTIAQRYALALLDIGVERKSFEQLGRELDQVAAMYRTSGELREVLRNPKFDSDARKRVLEAVLVGRPVSPVTRNFLKLLVDRNRAMYVVEIAAAYRDLADAHAGRVRAEVTVAAPLSETDASRLRVVLQRLTGRQVVLEQRQDPAMLGGVVTRVGGRVYDGSVRARLDGLRGRLKQTKI